MLRELATRRPAYALVKQSLKLLSGPQYTNADSPDSTWSRKKQCIVSMGSARCFSLRSLHMASMRDRPSREVAPQARDSASMHAPYGGCCSCWPRARPQHGSILHHHNPPCCAPPGVPARFIARITPYFLGVRACPGMTHACDAMLDHATPIPHDIVQMPPSVWYWLNNRRRSRLHLRRLCLAGCTGPNATNCL
jgi:hypothetical protein